MLRITKSTLIESNKNYYQIKDPEEWVYARSSLFLAYLGYGFILLEGIGYGLMAEFFSQINLFAFQDLCGLEKYSKLFHGTTFMYVLLLPFQQNKAKDIIYLFQP